MKRYLSLILATFFLGVNFVAMNGQQAIAVIDSKMKRPFSLESHILAHIIKRIQSGDLSTTKTLGDAKISDELKDRLKPVFLIIGRCSIDELLVLALEMFSDFQAIEALLIIAKGTQRQVFLKLLPMAASKFNHHEAFDFLLNLYLKPNAAENYFRTNPYLLGQAIEYGSYDVIKLLLESGADKNALQGWFGEIPLTMAQARVQRDPKYKDIVDLLQNYNQSIK